MPNLTTFGEKSKLKKALKSINNICKRRKGFKCVNITRKLRSELNRKGLLK